MKTLNKKNKGLTLIETLIAITILMMSTVMPLVIYSNSISNSRYASEQVTASYLAQEAVELVKYEIYTEFNNGNGWFSSLPNCNGNGIGNTCTVDVVSGVCSGSACDKRLYIDSVSNLYKNKSSNGVPTKFYRTVVFDNNPPKDGAPVSSTVTWKDGTKNKSVTVKMYLTKWR